MGDFGLNLDLLREVYGINCIEIDDRAVATRHTGAILQHPEYDFMIFPLVKDWEDGWFSIYAYFLEEGVGSRHVMPTLGQIDVGSSIWSQNNIDFVGILGLSTDAHIIAQYINGYIAKGEWAKWFRTNP
jgi:hypothetical protein